VPRYVRTPFCPSWTFSRFVLACETRVNPARGCNPQHSGKQNPCQVSRSTGWTWRALPRASGCPLNPGDRVRALPRLRLSRQPGRRCGRSRVSRVVQVQPGAGPAGGRPGPVQPGPGDRPADGGAGPVQVQGIPGRSRLPGPLPPGRSRVQVQPAGGRHGSRSRSVGVQPGEPGAGPVQPGALPLFPAIGNPSGLFHIYRCELRTDRVLIHIQ